MFTKFVSLSHHQLNNVTLFQWSLFHTEIFECAKITRWSHKKFCNFVVIEDNQMPLGNFYVDMNK